MLEGWPGYWPRYPARDGDAHIPILRDHQGELRADLAALEQCAAWLHDGRREGTTDFKSAVVDERVWRRGGVTPAMVHCGQGIERSPLTAAWFFHRRCDIPWEAAYASVCKARPETQRRDHWLPHEARVIAGLPAY